MRMPHWTRSEKKKIKTYRHAAKREMHDLVATFLKDGPLKPMYHVHWDRATDEVVTPKGYVNDEDRDADSYLSYSVAGSASRSGSALSTARSSTSSGADTTSRSEASKANSRRSSISSVGWDSAEGNHSRRHKDKKKKSRRVRGAAPADSDSDDSSKVSILSDALDPEKHSHMESFGRQVL